MNPQTLTPAQFIQLEKEAGFPKSAWLQGLRTAQIESSLNPSAINKSSGAAGLFQILPSHIGEPGIGSNLTDPLTNVKDAFVLWKRAGGTFYNDWTRWEPANASGGTPLPAMGNLPPSSIRSGVPVMWIIVGAILLLAVLLRR
jgi:Transglycosylase SLT domain